MGAFLLFVVDAWFAARIASYEPKQPQIKQSQTQEHQTAPRHPVLMVVSDGLSAVWDGLAWIGGALHTYHAEILGAFTIFLAVATVFLAKYTRGLWLETKSLVDEAKISSARQATQTQESIEYLAKAGYAMEGISNAMRTSATASYESAKAAHKLVERNDTNAQTQLRAYVLLDNEQILEHNNGKIKVTVQWKNFGQTPAHKVKSSLFIAFFPLPLTDPLEVPIKDNPSAGNIAPGATTKQFIDLPRALNAMEFNAVINGECAIYVWGRTDYIDVFGFERKTTIRYVSGGGDFRTCRLAVTEEGNDTD